MTPAIETDDKSLRQSSFKFHIDYIEAITHLFLEHVPF